MKMLRDVRHSGLENFPEASRKAVNDIVRKLQEYVGKEGIVGVTAGVSDWQLYAVVKVRRGINPEEIIKSKLDEDELDITGYQFCSPVGIPSVSAYNRRC